MKKTYKQIEINLIYVDEADVLTTSGPNASDENETTPMPFPFSVDFN